MANLLYKVTSADGRACHGGSGRWSLPDGDTPGAWMPRVEVDPCSSGYHLCRPGDLIHWLGERIWIAEGRGDPVVCYNKIVYPEARIVTPTRWDEQRARLFAADCAARVLHIYERDYPADDRPRLAIIAARDHAMGRVPAASRDAAHAAACAAASDAARDAAWYAAWYAAHAAACAAARDAARAAAWAASGGAQSALLLRYVHDEALPEAVPLPEVPHV